MSKQRPKLKSQVHSQFRWFTWLVSVTVAFSLVGNNPIVVTGQSQPPQQADQKAALEEAERLSQQAVQFHKEGKYSTAIPLAERVLAIREKVLGKEHPDVASSLNNLGELYREQGNYQKAEPLYYRSLAITEKVLGKEHPKVAIILDNLASVYQQQGNYQKAEPLSQRSLAIFEKVLGKEHPDVAINLINLAKLYWAKGDITHATDFYRRGLAVQDHNLELIFAVGSEQRKQDYTRTFTVKYYHGLKDGKGRHEALRSAQLELLSNPKYQHPYYWASFVPSGDWTMLHQGQ